LAVFSIVTLSAIVVLTVAVSVLGYQIEGEWLYWPSRRECHASTTATRAKRLPRTEVSVNTS
jgi:hypothetical protein